LASAKLAPRAKVLAISNVNSLDLFMVISFAQKTAYCAGGVLVWG